MKFQFYLLFSIITFSVYGQDGNTCTKKLKETFEKIGFYANQKALDESSYDSINKYNEVFEKLLLRCTNSNPETLNFDFKDVTKIGLKISTSKNNNFKIYSWDTETGGTMKNFRNVFQYKSNNKIYSQKLSSDEDEYGDSMYCYEIIDQVISNKKTFYVVKCISIGSSAVSSHKIKIFSIENGKLNDNAKLIKTKTGIRNELGYEIDFSSSANQNNDSADRENAWLQYDAKNKTIIIPLIAEDGKLTKKKIKYQFKGVYFEKI